MKTIFFFSPFNFELSSDISYSTPVVIENAEADNLPSSSSDAVNVNPKMERGSLLDPFGTASSSTGTR